MPPVKFETPPLLLLGGLENTVSIARSLGRKNIPVEISARASSPALRSRFCRARYIIPPEESPEAYWGRLLLGGDKPDLHGSVVLACADDAIAFLAKHHDQLAKRYVLDDSIPEIQLAMLDKQKTLELARTAGCPVPQFWKVGTPADLEPIHRVVMFPVMIKPIDTFLCAQILGKKFFIAQSHQDLDFWSKKLLDHGLRIMVSEIIPGPDREVQSSYYTYIDEEGHSLFRFTKRVLRRDPHFGGLACLHQTQWLPETAEMGERFFRGIGFKGLGNIEFKRDPRDGQLKVIECNARFTAAQELLVRCGLDIAFLIYSHLTNRPLPKMNSYRENVFLWFPVRDAKGQWKGRHGLSAWQWLRSVLHRQTAFPYFKLNDPGPSWANAVSYFRETHKKAKVA